MSGRYIDADATLETLKEILIKTAINNVGYKRDVDEVCKDIADNRLSVWLEYVPTADVREVVRCKDCMHTEIDKYAPAECQNRCKLSHQYHEPTFFCKCGEPRMDLLEWIHKGDADEQSV